MFCNLKKIFHNYLFNELKNVLTALEETYMCKLPHIQFLLTHKIMVLTSPMLRYVYVPIFSNLNIVLPWDFRQNGRLDNLHSTYIKQKKVTD